MKHRFSYLTFAALSLTLAAASQAVTMAVPVRHQPEANIEILVDGVAQRRYAHEGRWYVEALKGRDYAIRMRNPYGVRVGVALSVDGLNTIDARQTTAASARKWILEPYQTVTISGWQTSRTEARRFEFTTEERSYGEALGKTDNLGVISAAFFKERGSTRMTDAATDRRRQAPPAAPQPSAASESQRADASEKSAASAENEYAATGMGGRTSHAVTQVWLDLEDAPAQIVNVRYEFRPQLVRLGVVPPAATGRLERREGAHGFVPEFCPEPPRR
jgi:hypothetical protein